MDGGVRDNYQATTLAQLAPRSPAERRVLEDTTAAIRLRTRYHDPYEEWEREARRDARRTARHVCTTTQATRASRLQNAHDSARRVQQAAYSKQLADIRCLLESLRIKEREEELELRNIWKEEDRRRKERMEGAIRVEEEKLRVKLEEEKRKREEEERRRREEEHRRKTEEEERRKEEELRKKAREEQAMHEREQQERERKKKEKEVVEAEARKAIGMADAEVDWKYGREMLNHLKSGPMKTVKGDKALRSQWNAIRRQITPRIGQLTQDQETISRITNQLIELVRPATAHPRPLYLATLSSLSKAILLQAETEVTAEKKSAYPLALVTCSLLHHPSLSDTFPDVFYAKTLQRTGGWGVPVIVPAQDVGGKTWSDEERRKAMGYQWTGGEDGGEGGWESTGEHATRIAGIMRVYFLVLAMSVSMPTPVPAAELGKAPQLSRGQRLFHLPHFWMYFSRMLGDERLLETAVAAQILHVALDVAGLEARHIWGKQWIKLLELLYEISTVGIDSGTNAAGSGKDHRRILGGQTPEGKSARVRVQLEIERIMQAL
ncbi:hypothetical protein ID866_4029 [Astraeus odoratus]|nr:hypothetical protein ID866_4029 [Astraeus odoratus]